MMSIKQLEFILKTLFLLGGFFWIFPNETLAKTETNLSKALKSGDKTIEFSGKEKESVKIPKGVKVIGSSPEKAVISGDVIMANGSSLENITVDGKVISITVEKGASVSLSNVTVSGGSDTGIFAPKGGGTLTISNSRIRQNRKGIFLLEGKTLFLSGSFVSNNKEEGLDMHAGSQGSITGSTFSNNSEGGIEVILNGSGLTISKNTFSSNQASGLALQSYGSGGGGSKTGRFVVSDNSFTNNGNFGIDCKNPQGTGGGFFAGSVKANGNTFTVNKKGSINGECGITNRGQIKNDANSPNEGEDGENTEEDLIEEANEEMVTTELAERNREEIETKNENFIKDLSEQSLLLVNESIQYENRLQKKPWFYKKQTVEKALLEEKMNDVREELGLCTIVDSRELSLPPEDESVLCTKEEKKNIEVNLENTKKHLDYSFFEISKTFFAKWQSLGQDFFLREVWKF